MSRVRSELSSKNPYWIPKYRFFELKYFCLQYPEWKKEYSNLLGVPGLSSIDSFKPRLEYTDDKTSSVAIKRLYFSERISMVEKAVLDADESIYKYLLRGITEGVSYTYLKTYCNIPCSKDFYYDRYRRFFWLLNRIRN